MEATQRTYYSYLLRLWREERPSETVWRASLQSVQTGDRRQFAESEQLFVFLQKRMGIPDKSCGNE